MNFYKIITLLCIGLRGALATYPIGYLNQTIPFVVSIQKIRNGVYEHICVGTLITNAVVLTASECLVAPQEFLAVTCNVKQMSTSDALHRHSVVDIAKLNHVAGLVPDKAVLLKISPIILDQNFPYPKFDYTYKYTRDFSEGLLLAWGTLNQFEKKLLESVPFRRISTWTCFKENWKILRDTEFCAVPTGHRGACNVDAGGGLFSLDLQYIFGMLQSGDGNCTKNEIYLFNDIRAIKNWMNDVLVKWGHTF